MGVWAEPFVAAAAAQDLQPAHRSIRVRRHHVELVLRLVPAQRLLHLRGADRGSEVRGDVQGVPASAEAEHLHRRRRDGEDAARRRPARADDMLASLERRCGEVGDRRLRRARDAAGRAGLRAAGRAHRDLRQRRHALVRAADAGAGFLPASTGCRQLAAKDPSLKERQPFKAFLEHDLKTIHALGKQGVFEVAFATHAGMTRGGIRRHRARLARAAKHPKLGRLFTQCTYRPQVELLDYLRAERLQDLHRVRRRHRPDARLRRGGIRHSARAGDRLEHEDAFRGRRMAAFGADEARRARQLRRPRGKAAEHRPAHRTAADTGIR